MSRRAIEAARREVAEATARYKDLKLIYRMQLECDCPASVRMRILSNLGHAKRRLRVATDKLEVALYGDTRTKAKYYGVSQRSMIMMFQRSIQP